MIIASGPASRTEEFERPIFRASALSPWRPRIDFTAVNTAALRALPELLCRWTPGGKMRGHEWVVCNPRRADVNPGSFSINLRTGRWADFATGDKGGDVISLAAYLHGLSQIDAAKRLAAMLDLEGSANG